MTYEGSPSGSQATQKGETEASDRENLLFSHDESCIAQSYDMGNPLTLFVNPRAF